jgi:hypothetical protein
MSKTFIYALTDPRTGAVRYVGKANRPESRLRGHLKDRNDCHRVHWLRQLREEGLRPGILILEEVEQDAWQDAERNWIEHYGFDNLVNETRGGEGSLGHSHAVSLSARLRIARSVTDQWADPSMRERFVSARNTTEAKIRRSEASKRYWTDPSYRANKTGENNPMADPAQREKVSQGAKRSWKDPEIREKRIAAITAAWHKKLSGGG